MQSTTETPPPEPKLDPRLALRYLENLRNLRKDLTKQGIDPDDVKSFMWKDEFITPEVQGVIDAAKRHPKRKKIPYEHYFNCVRLQDDSVKGLVPPLRRPY